MVKEFDAQLSKGDNPGAWTCVILDDVHALFGTRGLGKIRGEIDGTPFDGALMAQGDGTHRLPVKATLRKAIGKEAGDTVHVRIDERIGSARAGTAARRWDRARTLSAVNTITAVHTRVKPSQRDSGISSP